MSTYQHVRREGLSIRMSLDIGDDYTRTITISGAANVHELADIVQWLHEHGLWDGRAENQVIEP